MESNGIVVLSPSFGHDLGLLRSVEYLSVEQLISQLSVEAFVVGVLPGTTQLNAERPNPGRGSITDACPRFRYWFRCKPCPET